MRRRFLYSLSVLPYSQNPVVGAVARNMHEAALASGLFGSLAMCPTVREKI